MWKMLMCLALLSACARVPLSSQPDGGPTGHLPPDRSTVPPVVIAAHKLTPGEVLFLRHCAGCHGAGARGDGPVGTALGLRPRNLRQAGLFPEDHDPAWINRILHGRAMATSVQSSQVLASDSEVTGVVQHLRRLPTLPWSEIDHGEKIYDSLCLSCHGVYGHGDGTIAKTLPAPPLDLATPPYQQQMTDEALFTVISEGKGGMPGTADVLSVDDRKAVVAVSYTHLTLPTILRV